MMARDDEGGQPEIRLRQAEHLPRAKPLRRTLRNRKQRLLLPSTTRRPRNPPINPRRSNKKALLAPGAKTKRWLAVRMGGMGGGMGGLGGGMGGMGGGMRWHGRRNGRYDGRHGRHGR